MLPTLLVIASLALLAFSAVPYIPTDRWFVRMADFPRLQLLLASAGMAIVVLLARRRWPRVAGATAAALLAAAVFHLASLWPFRPGGEAFVEACEPGRTVSVLVSNVLMENRRADALLAAVEREQPDLFLALETDDWWDRALAPVEQRMPYRVQDLGEQYYGIHLFSRLPLVEPRIEYLASQDVPAVVTGVTLPAGETVGFIGLHPRPPQPSLPSTGRDGQLYAAAFLLRESERPTIVAGDLNATPWEPVIERMRRVGGLVDPRRGYGYLATYNAHSWWQSWPIDHVLYQAGFATMTLALLEDVGSDHYPYLARLCRNPDAGEPPPPLREGDLEAARTAVAEALQEVKSEK